MLTHDTRPRDHPEHCSGRVRPTGVDPFSLLGDTGPGGPERSDPLPTHPETPPKHGFLDRSDLPSVRQLPVSWLSTQQAAKCQLSMGTQRRGGASHLPDPPSTPSSRSLGQEEPKMTFSLRWWEAYLSARRAAVVAPQSGRSFATLIGDAGVRVGRRRRTAADARVLVRELARSLRPPRLPLAKQRPEAPWIPLKSRLPP